MASVAAASAAVAAIGVWYSGRKCAAPGAGEMADFTEPPKTWGDSLLRLHEVVRVSWKQALSKLGIWRLDHLLAIRHLSGLDLSAEIAETVKKHGVLVEVSVCKGVAALPTMPSLSPLPTKAPQQSRGLL
jgi:hypothetical protein